MEQRELSKQFVLGEILCALDKAMEWIKTAKDRYNHMGQIVLNVCKAFENLDVRDLDEAIAKIPKPHD